MTRSTLGQHVARHDNDIAAIYDIAARLERGQKRTQGHVLNLGSRLDEVDGSLGRVEVRLATVIDLISRQRR